MQSFTGLHALTGCNSTSNLNGIGKNWGFTTLKKHKDDLVGLKNLGTDCTVISDETLTVYFKFIGLLYGEASNLNHLRYKLFTKKNLESSKLPPTEDRRCIVSCRRVGLSCTAACTCENECSSLQENDERRWTLILCINLNCDVIYVCRDNDYWQSANYLF